MGLNACLIRLLATVEQMNKLSVIWRYRLCTRITDAQEQRISDYINFRFYSEKCIW